MLPAELSFNRFTPTTGTRRALALVRAMAAKSAGAPRLLLLHGPPGVGKTHLLRAVLQEAQRKRPTASLIYATGAEVIDRLVAAFKKGGSATDTLAWKSAEIIALDDLHGLAGLELMQREIARLLQNAAGAGSRVVCASGGSLGELMPLVARLRESPGFALTTLQPANEGDIRRILLRMVGPEGVRPRKRALMVMAESASGDVRRAVGALHRYGFARSLPVTKASRHRCG